MTDKDEFEDYNDIDDQDYPDEPQYSGADDIEDPEVDDNGSGEEESAGKKYSPLPPFDITAGESFQLYDNMKYVCDTDLINRSMIKKESGNVCKGYRVKEDKPIKIGGDA